MRRFALLLLVLPAVSCEGNPGSLPLTFSLLSPISDATASPAAPTFTWEISRTADHYSIEVATDSAFSTIVASATMLTSTSWTPAAPLADGTVHWWRITAFNDIGSRLAANSPATFQTDVPSGNPPQAFSMTDPPDATTPASAQPAFTWTASIGAQTYTLQVATDAGFVTLVVDEPNLTVLTFTPAAALAAATQHWWRVTAVNAAGQTTATGAPFTFTTP